MGAIVDQCRRAEFALWAMAIQVLQNILIWWVAPTNLYFTAGWELRIRRLVTTLCYALMGLLQLHYRVRHAKSVSDAIFGVANCPQSQADLISSRTWSIIIHIFSGFLWYPLSWCSRRLRTSSVSIIAKYLKLLLLVPVELLRAVFWVLAVLIASVYWLCTSFGAVITNIFVVPLGLLVVSITLWLCVLYLALEHTVIPQWSRDAIKESRMLLLSSLSASHALQVVGSMAASVGWFGCRDRWFRRDALQSGISTAVRATLPGLIGPISCDQPNISDAVAAMRGLRNVWIDLEKKQRLVDDHSTLVYALSYKHLPVFEDGKMIRMSEARATNILRTVMEMAKSHGYRQLMLWCDGASAAGVRTDSAWVDIGLLPYAVYRTMRIETYMDGERLTSGRLWLELEKQLSGLTCGMDVATEYGSESGFEYETDESVQGDGFKAMSAVVRVASRIAQGDYYVCAVSRETDRTEIASWARKILMRSGVKEMNEALGWSGEPVSDRRAKALLMRLTTLKLRTDGDTVAADVAKIDAGNEVGTDGEWGSGAGRTEFWLGLLGFTHEELGRLENEELECFSAKFEEKMTGRWEMQVVSLQGDYYVYMALFKHVEKSEFCEFQEANRLILGSNMYRREGGWGEGKRWLLTNSQVEKSGDVVDWVKKVIAETFKTRGLECEILRVEHDFEESARKDDGHGWFWDVIRQIAEWQEQVSSRLKEKNREEGSSERDARDGVGYHRA